jgi:hypothetical protein
MYVLYRNRNYKINKKSAGHGTNIKKKKYFHKSDDLPQVFMGRRGKGRRA